MIRIAVVHPPPATPYASWSARSNGAFEVSHAVGQIQTADAINLASVDELSRATGQFDACIVHAPLADYIQPLTALADAGKHIFLDSTCQDMESLGQLSEVCRKSAVRLVISHPRRFTAYARAIREAVESDCLGSPGLVRIHRWEEQTTAHSTPSELWKMSVQEVDLACWLLGSVPTTVYGQSILGDGLPSGLVVHLGFDNGMAIVDCAVHQGKAFYAASLIGSQGAAYADDHHNTNLLFKKRTTRGMHVTGEVDGLRIQVEAFVKSITSATDNHTVLDMKRAISVCHAAVQSADANQVAKRNGDRYELP